MVAQLDGLDILIVCAYDVGVLFLLDALKVCQSQARPAPRFDERLKSARSCAIFAWANQKQQNIFEVQM